MDENDKKFYIVSKHCKNAGLMAVAIYAFYHTLSALNKGYIPIIDMKHYDNSYFKDNRKFKDNAWEYYFEQPLGYKLEDIDNSSQAEICDPETDLASVSPYNSDFPVEAIDYETSEKMQKYKDYFNKYIRFNAETKEYLEEKYSTIIGEEKEVLGVFARGTDYIIRRSYDHRIQPSVKQLIKKVKEVLKKYPEIKKIYLATEDLDIYNTFKTEFKDILLDNGQYRFSYKNKENKYKCLNRIKAERENHNYNLGLEYLTSLYILSKCKYFIGGRANGSYAVCYMSNGFKYFYLFNLGRYGRGLERLFSVVTEDIGNKPFKIYNILGLKFKFKLKNP